MTAKAFMMAMAFIIVINGVAVLKFGMEVNSSEAFEKIEAFYAVISSDTFDSKKVAMVSVFVAGGAILIGLGGCWGAMSSNHCALAIFGLLLGGCALVLIMLSAAAMVFIKSVSPGVKKELNRLCGPTGPERMKQGLECEEHAHYSNTSVARRLTQEASSLGFSNTTLVRRLTQEASGVDTGMGFMSRFMARSTVLAAIAMETTIEMPTWAGGHGVGRGRRLYSGVTEEDLLIRVCSRLGEECENECRLVDLICEPPHDFNPWEACVCDRSGPQAQGEDGLMPAVCPPQSGNVMCQMDSAGRRKGIYCMETTRSTPSDGAEEEETVEQCFVLPTAKCEGRGGTVPSDCSAAGQTPCVAQGPCTDPDSRSKLLVQAEEGATNFVRAAGLMGLVAMLMASCSFCLCCELHTGKSAVEHARSLAQNDPEDYYDDKDFWRSQGSSQGSTYLQ
eukprot:gnl/TRDRNA2_/TRDRNA2_85125_c0_seq2.p1 gnl/TRDRNA2_/TRDRNA2_85125_c0~~gnl/TRDRNA2_/TRDRNA2_85125_c0_seq2.p1  ORF type:complete len:483 (+),score=84.21 gnl/TRDRNA2_/TRDRNA2_85125_c0_seq2:108-1451(+)